MIVKGGLLEAIAIVRLVKRKRTWFTFYFAIGKEKMVN
ncbi:hypothetical protein ABIA69_000237 [Lysinibacillus parviboronicapiens]|uniref:Transcriptional regulator n=1 Tax=Lysinibacillus parviboronicapiens TaxID=436516 RepID=A0ABV2PDT7_9BACI